MTRRVNNSARYRLRQHRHVSRVAARRRAARARNPREVEEVAGALRGRGGGDREPQPGAFGNAVSCEISRIFTRFGFAPRWTRAPPALTTISLPCGVSAERTATTCGQPFGLASETRRTGAPKVSVARAQPRACSRHLAGGSDPRASREREPQRLPRRQRPVVERPAGPRVRGDLDRRLPVDPVREALQVAVEPCARLGQDVRRLSRRVRGGRVPEVGEVEPFGRLQARVGRRARGRGRRRSRAGPA